MASKKCSRRYALGSAAAAAIFPLGVRAAEFSWKFGTEQGPSDAITIRANQAFARVRDATGGRLEVKVFDSSILGGQPAMLAQLRSGALEVLAYAGSTLDSVVPSAGICGVGFAFKDVTTACAAFDGVLGKLVRADIEAKGMYALERIWHPGFGNLNMTTKPIRNADDMRDTKIRVAPSKQNIDLIRSMGASATPLASNEVFTALSTHLVDGVDAAFAGLVSLGWIPVIKYVSSPNHRWNAYWNLINKDKWASLPRNLQETMAKYVDDGALAERQDVINRERGIVANLESKGIACNSPDQDSFKAKLRANGYFARAKAEFDPALWVALQKYSDLP